MFFSKKQGGFLFQQLGLLLLFLTFQGFAADVSMKIVDQEGKPVEDAVVWVPGIGKPVPTSVVICQKQRQFSPMVSVIPVGSTVRFPNRDTVQHHIYSLSPTKIFDIPLYIGEAPNPVKFDQPGVVTLGCNIHDWMSAYVVVLNTTAFAHTTADGMAILKGISSGALMQVWHPRLRGKIMEVKAVEGGKVEISLRPPVRRMPYDQRDGGYNN